MSKRKGNALVIISLIIGASGLGIGVYSIIRFQVVRGPQGDPGTNGIDGVDGRNGTLNNIVGVWESINGGPNIAYVLTFEDIQVNESNFFTLTNGNASITLTQPGWYRFNIRFAWVGLTNTETYYLQLVKNAMLFEQLEYVYNSPYSLHMVDTFAYVHSDGDDVFIFYCQEPTFFDSFSVSTLQIYNQFVIEYVKES
jgi:hypothetical protein